MKIHKKQVNLKLLGVNPYNTIYGIDYERNVRFIEMNWLLVHKSFI